ncbi:hypothetical protein HAZT_HAZT001234 [Hyalella azteca]|uniref:Uncharacterized protein n=1 Tax=Hyalella azteca TaxID=294128 RepID=A0A6A0H758_HYAAZ|nr:hypothetical protein HAZT_HAZT001234 [Hyalella azteca]
MDVVPILLNPGTIHLDLSHNKIKTIQPGFAFYHELQVLNVSYNEIVALDARRNTSLNIEIEDVICATPESLKGKSISTLTDYELRCYGHLITIAISAAITLTELGGGGQAQGCSSPPPPPPLRPEEFPEQSLYHDPHQELLVRRTNHIQRSVSMITPDTASQAVAAQNRTRSRVGNGLGDPLNAEDFEGGPYASIAVPNGNALGQYESPRILRRLYSKSNSIYSDRKTTKTFQSRPQKMTGTSLKIPKDSGYYSCEFLDHSNNSSPQSDGKGSSGSSKEARPVNHYRDPELHNSTRKTFRCAQLPPSDSGVFTLSRSYSKSAKLAHKDDDGIYDNVL